MNITLSKPKGRRKKAGNVLNYLTTGAALGLLLAFEAFSSGAILQVNTTTVEIIGQKIKLGYVEAFIAFGLSLLSFAAVLVGGAFARDPRPQEQRKAGAAYMVSIALLLIPMGYLASGYAWPRQLNEWKAYNGSDAHKDDLATRADPMADTLERRDASYRLQMASKPATPSPNFGEWVKAILGHVCVWCAGFFLILARPETEAEAKRREKETRRQELKAEKEAKRKAEARAARSNIFVLADWLAGKKAA